MKDGEQEVLFVHFVSSLYPGLQHGQLQYVARFLVQHEVGRVYGRANLVFPDAHLQLRLDCRKVQVQPPEQADHRTVLATEHAQQQVLRGYGTAGQPGRFLSGESEYFRYSG